MSPKPAWKRVWNQLTKRGLLIVAASFLPLAVSSAMPDAGNALGLGLIGLVGGVVGTVFVVLGLFEGALGDG